MSRASRTAGGQAGFTLIEIMVVIVIIGLIATLVVPNVIDRAEDARLTTARANAKLLHDAATGVAVRTGRVPTLEELVTPDAEGRIEIDMVVRDPWQERFILRELDGRQRFEVRSMGPDRVEDTEDDIVHPVREPG